MTLRHMRIFIAVCDCESTTLAAEKLNFTQPAVSLAIKELENYYGVKLFDRISRRLFITESGKEFLIYSRQIISLFDEMETKIKDWDSFGMIRMGSSITIGTCLIPSYIKKFAKEHPKIKVNVSIDNSSIIINKILSNELDFALIEGVVHTDSIISVNFLEDELILVCGINHSLADRAEISLEELVTQAFILREKGSGTRELFDSTLLTRGLRVIPEWESISTEAIVNAVSQGLGISVLPWRLVERDLDEHRLIRLKIEETKFKRSFNIIYHKDKKLSGSALDFIDMCMKTDVEDQFSTL